MSKYRKRPVVVEAIHYDGEFPLAFLRGDQRVMSARLLCFVGWLRWSRWAYYAFGREWRRCRDCSKVAHRYHDSQTGEITNAD